MKLVLSICFVLFALVATSQKSEKVTFIKPVLKRDTVTYFSQPVINPDVLNVNYKITSKFSYTILLKPLKIYSYSSTIFDESTIILLDNSRFFAFHFECMQRFCSAGYYKNDHSTVTFSSNQKVLNDIKDKIDYALVSLPFADFKSKIFKEANASLIYVR